MAKEAAHDLIDIDEHSTKDRLICEGIRLFSEHGFEATTTRMLAESVGSNNAVVYFHFGSKENLYYEILNTVAQKVRITFQPLQDEILEKRSAGPITSDDAWLFIEKYIDLYIDILKNPTNNSVLYLLLHEQLNPVNNQRPITEAACRDGELMLVQLLLKYWNNKNQAAAAIVSRLATSSLIALTEHPSFVRLSLGLDPECELPEWGWQYIRSYTLNSLRTFSPAEM